MDYTIQYQDLDQNYRLRLYTLENYLLNSAGVIADQGGFGMRYLITQNCTWVLTNLSLEISYLPTVDEVLTVETWVEKNVHMLSMRNYRLYVNGRLIGLVKSVWAIISIIDRTAQNLFDRPPFLGIDHEETVEVAKAPRFNTLSPEQRQLLTDGVGHMPHRVVYSDIDYNGHCNSCKYLELMLNACEPVALKRQLPKTVEEAEQAALNHEGLRIDIKYAKEICRDDNVDVFFLQHDNQIDYEIRTAEGDISCQARIARQTNTNTQL